MNEPWIAEKARARNAEMESGRAGSNIGWTPHAHIAAEIHAQKVKDDERKAAEEAARKAAKHTSRRTPEFPETKGNADG